MKFNLLVLLVFVFFIGCSATMVSVPGAIRTSQYAPKNEKDQPGVVRYLNQGLTSIVEARRNDAYKQMFTACDGNYRIISEDDGSSGGVFTPVGTQVMYSNVVYHFITFECDK